MIKLRGYASKHLNQRHKQLDLSIKQKEILKSHYDISIFDKSIEQIIGITHTPLAIVAPVVINGSYAKGEYIVPFATIEAALVVSYQRGANILKEMGGCTTLVLADSLSRVPLFILDNLHDLDNLKSWLLHRQEHFEKLVEGTSKYCKLINLDFHINGRYLYFVCEYTTGNASGQNMVTVATQAIYEDVLKYSSINIKESYIESNMSGDKKASFLSFMKNRGKKVVAEIVLSEKVIKKYLHTTSASMFSYWQNAMLGSVMSGTIGSQGHYANGLSAMFLAMGQDIACVSEASVGITRFELGEDNSLYISVTLPNLIVGTVGGGTQLPSAKIAFEILDLPREESAKAFSEIIAGAILCGEISLIGSFCANQFTSAHKKYARGR